jgi:hypothetical protein
MASFGYLRDRLDLERFSEALLRALRFHQHLRNAAF